MLSISLDALAAYMSVQLSTKQLPIPRGGEANYEPTCTHVTAQVTTPPGNMAVPPAIPPSIPDADELIDAILAEKGPAVYKDGLSEDNWEEVSPQKVKFIILINFLIVGIRANPSLYDKGT